MTTTSATSSTANIVSTLGAGSGIDIQSLAQKLVDAEQVPRKAAIDAKVTKSEARITGYGALKSALSDLKSAFEKINDASDFASLKVANAQPSAVSVTTGPNAAAGAYDLQIIRTAASQRNLATFTSRSATLNSGAAFDLALTLGTGASAASHTVSVTNATPAGMVSAINGAKLGVSAQLLDTGSGVVVVVTAQEGVANSFTLAPTGQGSGVDFGTPVREAADASFNLNGVTLNRSSNTVTDALEGVTLKLLNPTSGNAQIEFTRETGAITDQIKALVTAYNDFEGSIKILGDRASDVETFGGVLAGDNLLSTIRTMVRRLITENSTTPGTQVKAPRDVGLSIDREGKLTLDETRLNGALQQRFDEVVRMFTAGTDNKSPYSVAPAGSAGEAIRRISQMLRPDGLIDQQSKSADKQVTDYKAQLTRLEDRMKQLLDRYIRQFAAMDSIVGESNNTRASIKSTFEAMTSSKD